MKIISIAILQADFVLYPFGIIIHPSCADSQWIKQFLGTKTGAILVFTVVIAGFIMTTFYRTVLLSYLTAINYEKAIQAQCLKITQKSLILQFVREQAMSIFKVNSKVLTGGKLVLTWLLRGGDKLESLDR